MKIIYLDVCCLNRPFDDQSPIRIRLEAEAVLLILARVEASEWIWLGSDILGYEIDQTPDQDRRQRLRALAQSAQGSVPIEDIDEERARHLTGLGFKLKDALHIACAERAGVDVLLTTDDRLPRNVARHSAEIRVRVENPLTWLRETSP